MSPVNLAECDPGTRQKVLSQIGETEGTTGLATIEPKHSSQLAKLEQARQMLAESRTLPEVKKIRDIAEAAKVYAKAANLGHEAQNYAAEIALLAARKAGEILRQLGRDTHQTAGAKKGAASIAPPSEYAKALVETQTPERTAQRWQEIAAVPQEKFAEYIESVKPTDDISAAGLLKAGKPPHVPKPKPARPIAEYKSLVDAIPLIRNGKEVTPPSEYSAADIVETIARFTDNLVNQRQVTPSDKKIIYRSIIRELQDILREMES